MVDWCVEAVVIFRLEGGEGLFEYMVHSVVEEQVCNGHSRSSAYVGVVCCRSSRDSEVCLLIVFRQHFLEVCW